MIVQHHTSQTLNIISLAPREKFQGWKQGGATRGYDSFHGFTLAAAVPVKSNIKQDVQHTLQRMLLDVKHTELT